jgi:hypothetical protein
MVTEGQNMDSTNNVLYRTRKLGVILADERIQHHGSHYRALKYFEIVPV